VNAKEENEKTALSCYRLSALFCFYGLIIFFAFISYQALPSPNFATLLIWLIQIAPLLIFGPGLHLNIMRANIWLVFIVLLYFVHGVLVAFDEERRLLGLIEITLCVGLFCSLFLVIKNQQAKN